MDNIYDNIMKILGTNKIKYNVLDIEFEDIYKGYETVNIHIDLNTILKPLFDTKTNSELEGLDLEYYISSAILNIVAHFRSYFVYRQRMSSRIFLYYTDSKLKNDCKYFKLFKDLQYKNTLINVTKGLKLVKIISKYCNKVYFIDTDNIEPAVSIRYYISEYTNKKTRNLVLTKDEMLYQLINSNKTEVLRLKRDDSVVLHKDNIYQYILRGAKYEHRYMSSELLSLYMSYSGVTTREVKGVCKTKILKTIDNLIEEHKIINEYYPKIEHLFDDVDLPERETVMTNFYKIDLENLYKKISKSDIEKLNNNVVDKFSKNDLKMLNVKYYTGELSLMLEELTLEPNTKTVDW